MFCIMFMLAMSTMQNELFPTSVWARVGLVYRYTGGVRGSDKGDDPPLTSLWAEWGWGVISRKGAYCSAPFRPL